MKHVQLYDAVQKAFEQIKEVLLQLTNEQYSQQCNQLFNATIGQHTRHIIELFYELDKGYFTGFVNYENRKRDPRIEQDKNFALDCFTKILTDLNKENKTLQLHSDYSLTNNAQIILETNYLREIAYNLEHTIHHMALIRVGVKEVSLLDIHSGFGVAATTIKYQAKCAQ